MTSEPQQATGKPGSEQAGLQALGFEGWALLTLYPRT